MGMADGTYWLIRHFYEIRPGQIDLAKNQIKQAGFGKIFYRNLPFKKVVKIYR